MSSLLKKVKKAARCWSSFSPLEGWLQLNASLSVHSAHWQQQHSPANLSLIYQTSSNRREKLNLGNNDQKLVLARRGDERVERREREKLCCLRLTEPANRTYNAVALHRVAAASRPEHQKEGWKRETSSKVAGGENSPALAGEKNFTRRRWGWEGRRWRGCVQLQWVAKKASLCVCVCLGPVYCIKSLPSSNSSLLHLAAADGHIQPRGI